MQRGQGPEILELSFGFLCHLKSKASLSTHSLQHPPPKNPTMSLESEKDNEGAMPLGTPQQDLKSKASLLQTVFPWAPSQPPLPWVVSPGVHYFVHDVFLPTTQGPRRLRPPRVVFVGKGFISPEKPSFPPLSAAFPRQSCVLWFVPGSLLASIQGGNVGE